MNKNTSSSGLGLSGVLTVVFVVLKLVGVISWSWWWVLSPTLINTGLLVVFLVIYVTYDVHMDKKYGIAPKKGKKDKWKF